MLIPLEDLGLLELDMGMIAEGYERRNCEVRCMEWRRGMVCVIPDLLLLFLR